jgi:DNA-binding CsgD family transcriptional regulator
MEQNYGHITRATVTDIPADLNSEKAIFYKKTIHRFRDEAVYIYSFLENKMIYADGWENLLGYADSEITMLKIVTTTTPDFMPFSMELNDKALTYLNTKTADYNQYSFTIELKKLHKNGTEIPLITRVGGFAGQNGQLTEIIGRSQLSSNLKFGKVMKYELYGPDISGLEELLAKGLFNYLAISNKESEALEMVANGLTFKEIATQLGVSASAIEKRILPLYQRFGVKSLSHLISFAHQNNLLS